MFKKLPSQVYYTFTILRAYWHILLLGNYDVFILLASNCNPFFFSHLSQNGWQTFSDLEQRTIIAGNKLRTHLLYVKLFYCM